MSTDYLYDLNEDVSGYTVNKINNSKFEILDNGQLKYTIERKGAGWRCNCPGFTYRHYCKHLDLIQPFMPKRHARGTITQAIKDILPKLKKITPKVEVVGSYRRKKITSKDIDILMDCSVSQFRKVEDILKQYANYEPVMAGDNIIRGVCDGIEMDINRLSERMNYYLALEYRTGPFEHNIAMRRLAQARHGSLSENELIVEGRNIRVTSERDIYDALGVEYQEPENRSEHLKYVQPKKIGIYSAYINDKKLGSAPSRAYAQKQVKQIRELAKEVSKEFVLLREPGKSKNLSGEYITGKVDLRITMSEAELYDVQAPFTVKSPEGQPVQLNRIELKIKPVLKIDNKRETLSEVPGGLFGGSSKDWFNIIFELFQATINKNMKMSTSPVGKLLNNDLIGEGYPTTIKFLTVPFPVESYKQY